MTAEQFVYWLQGFAEVHGSAPTTHEWTVIKDHLATVFTKVTPSYPNYPIPRDPFTVPQVMCSTSVDIKGASSFSPIPQGDSKLLF